MKKITLLLAAMFGLAIQMEAQNVNMVFRSNLPYPNQTCANIWGHVDSLGNEYALVGASQGLSIVDVTDPDNPFEVAQIPGPDNLWKEVKTWQGYAYVVTEGGNGVQIVNLNNLPSTNIPYQYWQPTINNQTLNAIHALHIDNGKLYLYGGDINPGGCIIADLSNPWSPVYLGRYSQNYIHDGYVRNDTLYGGHIYDGYFSIMDVSNPANPVILATQPTPSNFTHNTWLSDDSKTLFTTDEVSDSYLATYDISDINNIIELDRFQTTPGSGSVVHNTHINDDWAVTSWYTDGVSIVDGHRPQNLVEVARYDTYAGSGDGMTGAWGVYPFLPSGNLVVSNIDEGLFVLTPTYVRACYLEGLVTDSVCGTPLSGVTVSIISPAVNDMTDFSGNYKTGYHTPGTYTVAFSKTGYNTKIISGVTLTAGAVTNLDVQLYSPSALAFGGNVSSASATPMANVSAILTNSSNTYNFITDNNGDFSACNVVGGTYSLIAGAWGYQTVCNTQTISSGNTNVSIQLVPGYYDDFGLDYGWTVSSTSTSGQWERGVPVGTDHNSTGDANPGTDVIGDCSNKAYVTGNNGGNASNDDVDNGHTILTSPVFDLSGYTEPYLFYKRWFFNDGGFGNPNDSLIISISNGTSTAVLETVTAATAGNSTWLARNFKISDYVTPSATMTLTARTADAQPGHLVEAGLDHFYITDSVSTIGIEDIIAAGSVNVYPNPFTGSTQVEYSLEALDVSCAMVITDVTGRVVKNIAVTEKQGIVRLGEELSQGIYFVQLKNGSTFTNPVKLVKVK